MRIKWLGHASFYIEVGGVKFLVDPWLDNPAYPTKPKDFAEVNYVVVTHDHGDHLGNSIDVLRVASRAKLVAIYEIAEYVGEKVGMERVVGANIGGPIKLPEGVRVVLTPALHSSTRGSPTGVVLGTKEEKLYHAGDTGVFYDMKLIGELYKPKVALLPIGGHFTMGPQEAALAVDLIRPRYAIPMHYGTFPVLWGTPQEFIEEVRKRSVDVEILVPKPGEEVSV